MPSSKLSKLSNASLATVNSTPEYFSVPSVMLLTKFMFIKATKIPATSRHNKEKAKGCFFEKLDLVGINSKYIRNCCEVRPSVRAKCLG